MKLFLASFLEKENFGPGRIISITASGKPRDINVGDIFLPLTPSMDLIGRYNETAQKNKLEAGQLFVTEYKNQLSDFFNKLESARDDANTNITDLLPFEDGDTLCSWERKNFTNYRSILSPFLEKMGYQVVLN